MNVDEMLAQARLAVADLWSRPVWATSSDECVAVVETSHALINQLTALAARHVTELDGRGHPGKQGATSMRIWLRDHLRISIHAAKRLCDFGLQLDTRPAVTAAVAAGALGVEQAVVIGAACADLPDHVGQTMTDACEAALIDHASSLEPGALRSLGERVLQHVAPEIADEILRRKLDDDEARAHQRRGFTMTAIGGSVVRLSGSLDAEAAAIIKAAIEPLCRPIPSVDDGRDLRIPAQRRADALVDVCQQALGGADRPDSGGGRAQVSVTIDIEALRRELAVGILDDGSQLSAAAVRRLACDALIVPAVFGGRSEVLDLGRLRRTFTGAIRRALILRDRGCAFPGCDRPPRWTEGHHIVHWADGGGTDLSNGVLLCRRHHRAVHHEGWRVQIAADALPEFIPPAYIDLLQQPRRNLYHQRQ